MLCSACQSIFRGPLIFGESGCSERRDHHLTAQSFARAIRQNCYICSSMFQQYQGDIASTLGLPRFAEELEGTQYYFSTEDGPHCLTLWFLSRTEPYKNPFRYDEHEIKLRPFVQLRSAPAITPLWRQIYLRRHANLRPTPHQSLVGSWLNNGYRLVLPIIQDALGSCPQLRSIQLDSLR